MNFLAKHGVEFTTDSADKICAGVKTQTRRVSALQPTTLPFGESPIWRLEHWAKEHGRATYHLYMNTDRSEIERVLVARAPYVIGQFLYVKEPHLYHVGKNQDVYVVPVPADTAALESLKAEGYRKRSSRFLPRSISRAVIWVSEVRAQRLQEISAHDCVAEGVELLRWKTGLYPNIDPGVAGDECTLRDYFKALWDSINGKSHPWASNPWVYVYTFRKEEIKGK